MSNAAKNLFSRLAKIAIIALPCLISMYTLYWLEYRGIWALDTPHRGKTSVFILFVGMSLSMLLFTKLLKRS